MQSKEKATLQLFELYHKDTEIDDNKKELKKKRHEVKGLEDNRKVADEKLKAAKKQMGEKAKEVAQLDQATRVAVSCYRMISLLGCPVKNL